jgi:hypothetical protein
MEEPPGQLHRGGAIGRKERDVWSGETHTAVDGGRGRTGQRPREESGGGGRKSRAAAGGGRAARRRAVGRGRGGSAGVTRCFFPKGMRFQPGVKEEIRPILD